MKTTLKPLPAAVIAASRLRKMAKELILEAEALESSCGVNEYQGKKVVEFQFSAKKRKEQKP